MIINRYTFLIIVCLNFAITFVVIPQSRSIELSGNASIQNRFYPNGPLYSGQERNDFSLAIEPELYHKSVTGASFTFRPFARIDSVDPERSHFDIRELNFLWFNDEWELTIGISKVFWGVTEFVHLVDIINQTDFIENIDGEDKLGQPMLNISMLRDWGVVDVFILPYFRERTFPGEKGRFRPQLIIDTDRAIYESSDQENHIDFAVRYSHTVGAWDFGIYHFNGTGREPSFVYGFDSGSLVLFPKYWLIEQSGLDLLTVQGNWLLKLESIYRSGQGESFYAAAGGVEYSFINIGSSGIDLGLIGEWTYDDREDDMSAVFKNDLMIGARLAFNDVSSTELLSGLIIDVDNNDRVFSLESSRRLTENLKITLDAYFIIDSSEDSLINLIRDDDTVTFELAWYF